MGGQKIESAQNINASRGQCKTHANQFCWAPHLFSFRDIATLKMAKFSFQTMVTKKFNQLESAQKNFLQVGLDVTCMYTDFSGHSPFSFGDTITLKNGQISLSDHGPKSMIIKKFNQSESAQKIYASRP